MIEQRGFFGQLGRMERMLRRSAVQCLQRYFADKSMHCGGAIPQTHLFSDKNISLLIDTDFGLGVKACYDVLGSRGLGRSEIAFVVRKIADLNKHEVPKAFQPGMILIFLRYCMGYQWPANLLECVSFQRVEDVEEQEKPQSSAHELAVTFGMCV